MGKVHEAGEQEHPHALEDRHLEERRDGVDLVILRLSVGLVQAAVLGKIPLAVQPPGVGKHPPEDEV